MVLQFASKTITKHIEIRAQSARNGNGPLKVGENAADGVDEKQRFVCLFYGTNTKRVKNQKYDIYDI